NLSRSRFWGTPLPIWMTKDRKEEKCIGSLPELKAEVDKAIKAGISQKPISDDIDLHRPYVDEIILVSESGKPMFREPDLIDVWFDSGSMPYAQFHYPFENKEEFEKYFPADFIAEGVDQTRGWFFTLHVIAGLVFDSVAFKNVVSNGLVLDKDGNKMSKRLGNTVNPYDLIVKHGADALRWYMVTNANVWDNLKFNVDGVAEATRRFFGTLANTYSFFALYANLDGFTFREEEVPLSRRTESDCWILSKLNTLIKEVSASYFDYESTKAGRMIQDFVIDDLSNWYVRLNRKRFWKGDYNEDKIAAYQTLYTCLIRISQLMAPIAPFYAEYIYRNLNQIAGTEKFSSVHLADFPVSSPAAIDEKLEKKMKLAQDISSLVHSLRKKHKIKVRQPLSRILIPILNSETREMITDMENLILSEVNIKNIEYIDDTSGVLVKKIKPNFKKLGKEYGTQMKDLARAVNGLTQQDISKLEKENQLTLALASGLKATLTLEDVEISSEDIPGWSVANEHELTVALDITISDELRKEGLARDFVNRIQNLRKEMGLDVQDKIRILVQDDHKIVKNALKSNKEYICAETQALGLDFSLNITEGRKIDMDDLELIIKIEIAVSE
ncbi:MAG TPA: DUF5915 domain-containing protein, partial [Cyclobacteriaceae bacterium]|nr:DUF5915 domain-containing protein [Cyclobacteriaceae bacterium]